MLASLSQLSNVIINILLLPSPAMVAATATAAAAAAAVALYCPVAQHHTSLLDCGRWCSSSLHRRYPC